MSGFLKQQALSLLLLGTVSGPLQCVSPQGITNVGNSCFINATLQILFGMDNITKLLLEAQPNPYDPTSISYHFTDLVPHIVTSEGIPKLREFSTQCWKRLNIPEYSQGDANDLLTVLLDGLTSDDLHTRFKKLTRERNLPAPQTEIAQYTSIDLSSIFSHIPTTYVAPLRKEATNRLLLIVGKEDYTLPQCLDSYFKPETELFRPHYSEGLVEGSRQKFIEETQQYIVCSLERRSYLAKFTTQPGEPDYFKRVNPISFPLYGLSFKEYYANPRKDKGTYDLIGIIMHTGTATNGHYFSYVKRANRWYLCNDTVIEEVEEEDILKFGLQGHGKTKDILPSTFVYQLSNRK